MIQFLKRICNHGFIGIISSIFDIPIRNKAFWQQNIQCCIPNAIGYIGVCIIPFIRRLNCRPQNKNKRHIKWLTRFYLFHTRYHFQRHIIWRILHHILYNGFNILIRHKGIQIIQLGFQTHKHHFQSRKLIVQNLLVANDSRGDFFHSFRKLFFFFITAIATHAL